MKERNSFKLELCIKKKYKKFKENRKEGRKLRNYRKIQARAAGRDMVRWGLGHTSGIRRRNMARWGDDMYQARSEARVRCGICLCVAPLEEDPTWSAYIRLDHLNPSHPGNPSLLVPHVKTWKIEKNKRSNARRGFHINHSEGATCLDGSSTSPTRYAFVQEHVGTLVFFFFFSSYCFDVLHDLN